MILKKIWSGVSWILFGSNSSGVQLATNAEVLAGTDDTKAVSPLKLQTKLGTLAAGNVVDATTTAKGVTYLATSEEALSGLDSAKTITPATLQAKLDAVGSVTAPDASLTVKGKAMLASDSEVLNGTDVDKIVTPATLQTKINNLPSASTSSSGIVTLATNAEIVTGANTTKAITPAGLQHKINNLPSVAAASTSSSGVVVLAAQADINAGTNDSKVVTPAGLQLKVNSIPDSSEGSRGLVRLATQSEVTAGTDASKAVTPATLQAKLGGLSLGDATISAKGAVMLAGESDITTGTNTTKAVTPAGLQQKINAIPVASTSASGTITLATQTEVNSGADTNKAVTPATLQAKLNSTPIPTASATVLGGVKVGSGLSISNGVLSAGSPNGIEFNTRYLRKMLAPTSAVNGRRRYTHNIISNASEIELCRIDLHGMGHHTATGSQGSTKCSITINAWTTGVTMELTIHKHGSNWRIDLQNIMGGSTTATDYWAFARGGQFKDDGTGWKLMTGGATDTNSAITSDHSHYIGASGAEWAYPPVFWPSQSSWNINHTHPLSVPYKINKTQNGTFCSSFADAGSSARYMGIKIYTNTGTEMANPYTTYTSNGYIQINVTNLPLASTRTIATANLEFEDCNHTIWFYDSERAAWETRPVVGVTGASDVAGTDLQGLLFGNNNTISPYGSVYRFIWTEKRGYHNYAKDGDLIFNTFARMRTNSSNGELELYNEQLGWSAGATLKFTHLIVGAGTNDSTALAMKYRPAQYGGPASIRNPVASIRDWADDPVADFNTIVQYVNGISANVGRKIEVVLLLFSNLTDPQAVVDTGGGYPLYDLNTGAEFDAMDSTDWQLVINKWAEVSDALYAYAYANNIRVIDWWTLTDNYKMDNSPGSFMCKAGHLNFQGNLTLANYADVVRRV